MFDIFDLPDMNVTAGARNVSTVPTQALTLLNDPFVLPRRRSSPTACSSRPSDAGAQVDLAYRIALARPADAGAKSPSASSLIAQPVAGRFTHVLLNLNEFLYMR